MKKTVSFSKNSTNIFFHILTQCNLNCRHCYINPKQHGNNTLSLSTIDKWIKAIITKRKEANIIFLGGEPTLHPELSQIVKNAKISGCRSVTIDTNGYLFNDILSKVGPDEVDYFSFSLDGATKQTNDIIRGKGSYDNCVAGIKKAVLKNFNVSLIYTVSRDNIDDLKNMIPLVIDMGINRFFIQIIGIRGKFVKYLKNNTGNESNRDFTDKWLSIVPDVAERIAESKIIVSYPKVFLTSKEPFECAGIEADNYFIFPNGRVYRCPLCEDYPVHSLVFDNDGLIKTDKLNEKDFFSLNIPEGCVMNRLVQPGNISYKDDGTPEYKIACCMLKEEVCDSPKVKPRH